MAVHEDFDLLIVGGGIVGLALASALRESPFRILLAEAGQYPVDSGLQYDLRVNSIHLGSQAFLQAIGAWSFVAEKRYCPYSRIEVWDAAGGRIEFDADTIGEQNLGAIVENNVLAVALNKTLEESTNIEKIANARLESLRLVDQSVVASFGNAGEFRVSMVAGADGGNSDVRQMIGLTINSRSYNQRAFVAKIGTEQHHEDTAYQKFLADGPLAFLPLDDGSSSIVWSCESERSEELNAMTDSEFEAELARSFDYRLGETTLQSKRVQFPLRRFHLDSYMKNRTVLIGDAAHVIHPLAGMGANLGLMDAASLAETLTHNPDLSENIWNDRKMREYERCRKAAVAPVLTLMDGFDWGFRSKSPILQGVRGIGLELTDRTTLAKNTIMRFACGLSGDLPDIARR